MTMGIRALYDEDVLDIMEYLKLGQLPLRHYPWRGILGCETPHELAAARAGYGLGLCESYWNGTACDEEENAMPRTMVAGVSYSEHAVALSTARVQGADIIDGYDVLDVAVGFGIGDEMRRSAPNQTEYWKALATNMSSDIFNFHRNWSAIFLYGPSIDEPVAAGRTAGDELEGILRALISRRNEGGPPQVFRADAGRVSAVGAARLALRGRFVDEVPEVAPQWSLLGPIGTGSPSPWECPWYAGELA